LRSETLKATLGRASLTGQIFNWPLTAFPNRHLNSHNKFSFRPLDVSSLAPSLRITNVVRQSQGLTMDVIQSIPAH
jgi:hypothetical protein